jgi:hypothetical protein
MADGVTVSTTDLRAALNMLLDVAEARFGPDIALGADRYWNVDLLTAFDMNQAPEAAVDVGSLADNVASMRQMLVRGGENVVLWHDLAHAVGVLRRVAAMDLP